MPCNSSTLVTRLLNAHGVVLGKTRMHELAEGVTSINVYGGPVLNPYNNTMHVGGALLQSTFSSIPGTAWLFMQGSKPIRGSRQRISDMYQDK